MRDSRGRLGAGSGASPSGATSDPLADGLSGGSAPVNWTGVDSVDKLGLLTAGDAAGDPPSVGDEELTDDLSRETRVPNENHPDTVRLEPPAAKGPSRTNGMARQKALLSPRTTKREPNSRKIAGHSFGASQKSVDSSRVTVKLLTLGRLEGR
jgi:hypothetical protein